MKRNKLTLTFFLILFIFLCIDLAAQFSIKGEALHPGDKSQYHIIKLRDGTIHAGWIYDLNGDRIQYVYRGDSLMADFASIRRIEVKKIKLHNDQMKEYNAAKFTRNKYRMVLIDGSSLVGTITKLGEYDLTVNYQGQEVELSKQDIAFMFLHKDEPGFKTLRSVKDQIFSTNHLPYHQMVVSPSAIPLDPGTSQYSTHYGMTHMWDFSVNRSITASVGFSLPAVFVGRVKFGVPIDREQRHWIGGNLYTLHNFTYDNFTMFVPTITYTFGTKEGYLNINLGRSLLFNNYYRNFFNPLDRFSFRNRVQGANIVSIGGYARTAERWSLNGEVIFKIDQEDFETSFGMIVTTLSWFKRRNRFDFGLITAFDIGNNYGGVYPLPYIGYSLKLKDRRRSELQKNSIRK